MDTNTFMGMLVAAIVVLVGLAVALTTLIIRPVLNLNKNITELTAAVNTLSQANSHLEQRVTAHGKTLDEHSVQITENTKDIEHLKGGRSHGK